MYQIATFYEFTNLSRLTELKKAIKVAMEDFSVFGTVILAEEGFNSTICAEPSNLISFIAALEEILDTKIEFKSSRHIEPAFKRRKVKLKREIVALRKSVDVNMGIGTHLTSEQWNEVIGDPETLVLDVRNDYEFQLGTFQNAINPATKRFNELPDFVEKNLDPKKHRRIAIFCTGGIRCEKFAPYLLEKGFEEVYQLNGGILKYLQEIPKPESLWEGECFVFDERISVDQNLNKGSCQDLSQDGK